MQPSEVPRTFPAKSLDFWFDYTCPYAYLGSTQARAVARRMGVTLTYRPLLLGGVFRAHGTPQKLFATLSAAKNAHGAADMQRWARHFGVVLSMPSHHPMRSVEALRATLATGIDPRVVDGFFHAYWIENAPISDQTVIERIVASCGHDPDRILRAIETDAVKNDLRARTDQAIALGIFGVPTWIVDGRHLYWGQDRLAFVERGTAQRDLTADPSALAEDGRENRKLASDFSPHAGVGASSSRRHVDVYWDFSSPFAYLGTCGLEQALRLTSADVTWRPVLLGGLFRDIGTPEVPLATFSEAKQRAIFLDLTRWAEHWRVPFRFPSRFPTNSLRALRVYLALPEDRRPSYRAAVFRACWAEDRDITDDVVLASCIGDDARAREALAKANAPEIKAELRAATEHAKEAGVFGVPTFVVDGEIYWGQDRLDLVLAALRGRPW